MATPNAKRKQLLTNFKTDKSIFLKTCVSIDESWANHYKPETKIQNKEWKHKGPPPAMKFKV